MEVCDTLIRILYVFAVSVCSCFMNLCDGVKSLTLIVGRIFFHLILRECLLQYPKSLLLSCRFIFFIFS